MTLTVRARRIPRPRPDPRLKRVRRTSLSQKKRPLPGRLKPVRRTPLNQKKMRLQKNGDNSSKPDRFHETARSPCCELLFFLCGEWS